MVTRVVFATALVAIAFPATAQVSLPYEIDNFFQPQTGRPEPLLPPQMDAPSRPTARALPEPSVVIVDVSTPKGPRLAYDLQDMMFDRVPDHHALAYRLDGLTDYTPQYRDGRDVDPLRYEIEGLLYANYAALRVAETFRSAASP